MARNVKDQSSSPSKAAKVNAGVHGDLKCPSEGYVFPAGEPQHDDVSHYTGIGTDVFTPILTKTGRK